MNKIDTEMVEFKANGDMAPGYLARPDDGGSFPGVVVIQEWWGLTDHIKSVANRLAREGFAALAPDLYRGKVAEEPDDARKLVMDMDRDQAIKDIQGAVNYLTGQPFVEPKKVGVVGFCMGGALATAMSYLGKDVGAVVVFYGRGFPPDDAYKRVSAPILGLYGEDDGGIPVKQVREFEKELLAHGKTHDIVIYTGAGHAFFNEEREAYRKEPAADAWARTLGWFRRHLK